MDQFIDELQELKEINRAYRDPQDQKDKELLAQIDCLLMEIPSARVYVPIIGKFSSGKSALVNTLLGYRKKILREDITPETAVPAEISYSSPNEGVTIVPYNGPSQEMDLSEYRRYEPDAEKIRLVQIQLDNEFLALIPDVVLVDMPGFESGYEIHDRAIDDYLPQSMAYIIAVPADDMILRKSVGDILRELCLHDMPVCLVITKCDKKSEDYDEQMDLLKKTLQLYIGDRDISVCETSSFEGDATVMKNFLAEIQDQSGDLLTKKYIDRVLPLFNATEMYLKGLLNCNSLSESEWEEQFQELERQLKELDETCNRENAEFKRRLPSCINAIKTDAMQAVRAKESTLVDMALNGRSNEDMEEVINDVLRYALTESTQKHLIPLMNRYVKRISECVDTADIPNIEVSFSLDARKVKTGVAGVAAVVIGALGGLATFLAGWLIKNRIKNKKREEAEEGVRHDLRDKVYPEISGQLDQAIADVVQEQADRVIKSVDQEVKEQGDSLSKAMTDARENLEKEKNQKEKQAAEISADLERIGELKNALQQ